jgi:hypothetical protein
MSLVTTAQEIRRPGEQEVLNLLPPDLLISCAKSAPCKDQNSNFPPSWICRIDPAEVMLPNAAEPNDAFGLP